MEQALQDNRDKPIRETKRLISHVWFMMRESFNTIPWQLLIRGSVTNPPDIPLLPVIKYLNVSPDPTEPTTIIIAWSPAVGATSYLLQASFDGTHWVDATATTGTTHTWATGRGNDIFKGLRI